MTHRPFAEEAGKSFRSRKPEGFSVCVGGIPGVGKSTTLRRHVQEHEPRDCAVVGSSVIRATIAPATLEEFDSWPPNRRTQVRVAAVQRLRQLRRECAGRLLVDGHFTLRDHRTGTIDPVFTLADRDFYDALILLEAPLDAIILWRREEERNRGSEVPDEIMAHLEAERSQALHDATEMGVPFRIVNEPDVGLRLSLIRAFLDECASLEAPG